MMHSLDKARHGIAISESHSPSGVSVSLHSWLREAFMAWHGVGVADLVQVLRVQIDHPHHAVLGSPLAFLSLNSCL